ncbi:hypothetical protein EON65_16905 [archaeon]|nr:MAG: hypothetical protein EON65_16905 [archaeon]
MSVGFYCTPGIQQLYLVVTGLILVVGMAAPWITIRVYGQNLTPFIFAALVASGLIPFGHWIAVTPMALIEPLVMVSASFVSFFVIDIFCYTCLFICRNLSSFSFGMVLASVSLC